MRRGARVAESGGLENRCTRKGTVGSNPTLSARIKESMKDERGRMTFRLPTSSRWSSSFILHPSSFRRGAGVA